MASRRFNLRDATKAIDSYSSRVGEPVQYWALCANNYPFSLSGDTNFERAFDFNGLVRKHTSGERGGVSLVEMSDDCFAQQHLVGAGEMIRDGRILREIATSAERNGVFVCAMGTGAKLSYEHPKMEGEGFFDRSPQAQGYWFNKLLGGWGLWGQELAQVYTGKRPAIFRNKRAFTDRVRLRDIAGYVKDFSPVLDLSEFSIGHLNPNVEISGAEALNLALVYALNKQTPDVTILSEQMQILGMNPNTPSELKRNSQVMRANFGFYGTMLDHGHVAIRGTRTIDDPDAYDIRKFVGACSDPLVFAHHNIEYKNAKEPGTKASLERDRLASVGGLPAQFQETPELNMPYPNLIYDINDAMLELRSNSHVSVVVLSPEPKCGPGVDMDRLARDVAEASKISADKIKSSGLVESEVVPMTFTSPKHLKSVDGILRGCLVA